VLSGDVDVVRKAEICCGLKRVINMVEQPSKVLALAQQWSTGVQPHCASKETPAGGCSSLAMSLTLEDVALSWPGAPGQRCDAWSSIPAKWWGCLGPMAPVITTTFNW